MEKNYRNTKVIIIGAGPSGLAASLRLQKEEIPHVVLEARDRIGGRVWTHYIDGKPVEMGASFIHGHINNPLVGLAKAAGSKTIKVDWDDAFLNKNVPNIQTADFMDKVWKMESLFEGYRDKLVKNGTAKTVADVVEYIRQNHKFDPTNRLAFEFFTVGEIEADYGSALNLLDADYFDAAEGLDGDDLLVSGGYIKVFEAAAAKAPVLLNQVVRTIQQKEDGCLVRTEANVTFEAEFVICTAPLGVLKKNKLHFTPPLSAQKTASINRMGFGYFDKIFVQSDVVFWQNTNIILFLKANNSGQLCYAANLHKALNNNTLLIFVPHSFNLRSKSAEQITHEVHQLLKEFYPQANVAACNLHWTNWGADPLAEGSYSSFGPGASPKDVKELARPEGMIHFAGEHTSTDHLSTVHGAWLSGIRAADEVIALIE